MGDEHDHLFVYGTLLAQAAHPVGDLLRAHGKLIGRGWIQARLYDLGSYPGAVLSEFAEDIVRGEVYRVKDWGGIACRIDAYEGCADNDQEPRQFQRLKVAVNLNGGTVIAWAYLYTGETAGGRLIQGGDYGAYLRAAAAPQ